MTAKEIADDVQQTFENVSNKYRNILEERIEYLVSIEKEKIALSIHKIIRQLKTINDHEIPLVKDLSFNIGRTGVRLKEIERILEEIKTSARVKKTAP